MIGGAVRHDPEQPGSKGTTMVESAQISQGLDVSVLNDIFGILIGPRHPTRHAKAYGPMCCEEIFSSAEVAVLSKPYLIGFDQVRPIPRRFGVLGMTRHERSRRRGNRMSVHTRGLSRSLISDARPSSFILSEHRIRFSDFRFAAWKIEFAIRLRRMEHETEYPKVVLKQRFEEKTTVIEKTMG